MSERDPFEQLRDLIDDPVSPRADFAAELRARLMSDMSASLGSREEHRSTMDAAIASRPRPVIPIDTRERRRPIALLELAAVALVALGLVAALSRGWFGSDPEPPTSVPAVSLQGDQTPTPSAQQEPTATVVPPTLEPTVVPADTRDVTQTPAEMEPTIVPPGNIPNTIWAVPMPSGESVDFGGMLVEGRTVYRLLATPSFVGIQAVQADTGAVRWQQPHSWAGRLFVHDDDTLYLDGGSQTLTAVDAKSGQQRWQAGLDGNPVAVTEEDDRLFVLLDTDAVVALSQATGEPIWTVAGTATASPQETGAPAMVARMATEKDTVAVVTSTGSIIGLSEATGEVRWTLDGYRPGMTSIVETDDRLVIVEGATDGIAAVVVVDGDDDGTSAAGAAEPCGAIGSGRGVSAGGDTAGTPAAGASAAAPNGMRIQGIDPKNGELVWDIPVAGGPVETNGATGDPVVCVVDAKRGTASGIPVAGAGGTGLLIGDDAVLAMVGSGQGLLPIATSIGDDDGAILAMPSSGAFQDVIAAIPGKNGTAYLQLADGTLIEAAIDGMAVVGGDDRDDGKKGAPSDSDDDGKRDSDDD